MPQKLKGSLTYMVGSAGNVTQQMLNFKLPLPCSTFVCPAACSKEQFAAILGSGELCEAQTAKIKTAQDFSAVLGAVCRVLHLTGLLFSSSVLHHPPPPLSPPPALLQWLRRWMVQHRSTGCRPSTSTSACCSRQVPEALILRPPSPVGCSLTLYTLPPLLKGSNGSFTINGKSSDSGFLAHCVDEVKAALA